MLKPVRHAGFTLIEVIVVIALIGLLMAYIAPQMFGRADDAKRKAAGIQLERIVTAIDLYKLETGSYPRTLLDLVEAPAGIRGWHGPYLRKRSMLTDPWGNQLVYVIPGKHGSYDLLSTGTDGQRGGTGSAADIGNWE